MRLLGVATIKSSVKLRGHYTGLGFKQFLDELRIFKLKVIGISLTDNLVVQHFAFAFSLNLLRIYFGCCVELLINCCRPQIECHQTATWRQQYPQLVHF